LKTVILAREDIEDVATNSFVFSLQIMECIRQQGKLLTISVVGEQDQLVLMIAMKVTCQVLTWPPQPFVMGDSDQFGVGVIG
jgi:hypothetical protein